MSSKWMILPVILAWLVVGCDLLSGGSEDPDHLITSQLYQLQIALETGLDEGQVTKAAVLCIVDSLELSQNTVEDEEAGLAAADAAKRRERLVRQALNESLVANVLIDMIQPSQEMQETNRQRIVANNSPALSVAAISEAGEQLGVEFLINALIDRDGAEVNLAAQRVSDGVAVFQDTLKEWPLLVETAAAEPE